MGRPGEACVHKDTHLEGPSFPAREKDTLETRVTEKRGGEREKKIHSPERTQRDRPRARRQVVTRRRRRRRS